MSGFVDWRNQAGDMVWLLAERDEDTVGAGYALVGWHTPPIARSERRSFRRTSAARALASRSSTRSRAGRPSTTARSSRVPSPRTTSGSLAWAARHGYHEMGRNSRLVLDLTSAEIAEPAPPEGIEIVTWADRPELAEGLWEVAREATPDIPGEEEDDIGTLEEWLERDMRGASDDPRAVFAALEHGEVVGYAKLAFSAESTERAFHDLTGVRRAHRGRGIAAALKRTQIAWAKANGYTSLQTSNEVRNEPIRRLNERYGYVLEPGVVIVRGGLGAT